MQYFNTLPKLIKTDAKGNSILLTNLMARASLVSSLMTSPAVYYRYDIQEGDTPEIIAYKYYGDSYRYWIVLFINQIVDPQWQWPMSTSVFQDYLEQKYGPTYPFTSTVHHYEKIITSTDIQSNQVTERKIIIAQAEYNSLVPNTEIFTLPSGGRVTVTTSKLVVSVYDYELNQNEKNRNIKILKSTYVNQMEKELTTLMAQ